jgi:hypothetical protein
MYEAQYGVYDATKLSDCSIDELTLGRYVVRLLPPHDRQTRAIVTRHFSYLGAERTAAKLNGATHA